MNMAINMRLTNSTNMERIDLRENENEMERAEEEADAQDEEVVG